MKPIILFVDDEKFFSEDSIKYDRKLESLVENVTEKAEGLFNYQSVRTASEFYFAVQGLFVPRRYSGKGFFRGEKNFSISVPGDLESELINLTLNPFHKSVASYTRMALGKSNTENSLEINKAIVYVEPLVKGLPLLVNMVFKKVPIFLVPTEVNIDGKSKKFDFTSCSTIHTTLKQS